MMLAKKKPPHSGVLFSVIERVYKNGAYTEVSYKCQQSFHSVNRAVYIVSCKYCTIIKVPTTTANTMPLLFMFIIMQYI